MAKFILHGVVVEKPTKSKTIGGLDCVNIVVEERFKTQYSKEIINYYSVDFLGKQSLLIPDNVDLMGATVIVTGSVKGRMYKDKYYNDLNGDGLTIVNTTTFVRPTASREQASVQPTVIEVKDSPDSGDFDNIALPEDIPDDDLPF